MTDRSDNLLSLSSRADLLLDTNQLVEAAEVLFELVQMQPNWERGDGWFQLSCIQDQLGRASEALASAEKAMLQQPHHPLYLMQFVELASRYGEPNIALAAFETMVHDSCSQFEASQCQDSVDKYSRIAHQLASRNAASLGVIRQRLELACQALVGRLNF